MDINRLYFIDIVRAFAILMMLQGHFIDTLLDTSYRDLNHPIFIIWSYFRGITAPTFFTISGLIFTYLLLKAKEKGLEKQRMVKGITRGFFLIGIGYLLRIPFFCWLAGKFDPYFLIIDVLQIIGLSLILIICFYFICNKKTILFSIVTLLFGFTIFITEPLYRNLNLTSIPIFLNNYVSKTNGSVFTIIPWSGYVCFGAFLATIFNKNVFKKSFKKIIITSFTIFGGILIFYSSDILVYFSKLFRNQLLMDSASYNYLFTRLGNVLLIFSFFYGLEKYFKKPLILKVGQQTLSIYVIHFIIIYGSFTGYGLNSIIGKNLTPMQAIPGAILFLVTVCLLSFYYAKTNTFLYLNLRKLFHKLKLKA
ncbi:heparan-alpha-glucosaminide N-acetyltransferase domain-containing protein [Polaribacter sp. NJDZ03]|uniref:heparan-alpha-glucosaminide N-acetyltransferase domain-containing protein n=1 Tax=Polaribacter sp. NJDZ03 TaxID=2855841 RepID=UPI001C4A324B|nr:heparan-alpha-glucosaminide N-acetyltransferase domain-containing protein [Polaribacter sp. NJDZ03]